MLFFMDPECWARLFGIVIIDLTLAGDNALVIALAVRTLPRRQQFWGRVWGTAGAVGLRLAFIAVATLLLRIPMLQLAGGLSPGGSRGNPAPKGTGARGTARRAAPSGGGARALFSPAPSLAPAKCSPVPPPPPA